MISGEYRHLAMRNAAFERKRSALLSRTALCGALSIGMGAALSIRGAEAGPQGTQVVGGSANVQVQGTHTEITQHTPTAILTHQSFNIQQNESVNFAQPSAGSLAVNKVIGQNVALDYSYVCLARVYILPC